MPLSVLLLLPPAPWGCDSDAGDYAAPDRVAPTQQMLQWAMSVLLDHIGRGWKRQCGGDVDCSSGAESLAYVGGSLVGRLWCWMLHRTW